MDSVIEVYKENAVRGMELFLRVFSHVPDDKLDWSPTPTSKSALRIAAHTAVTAGNFARMIQARKLPEGDEVPEFVARTAAEEAALTTRAEIEALLRKNTDEVLAALDTLTPDAVNLSLNFITGDSLPMTFLMNLPAMHAALHTGQLDFLQTCWDDQVIHLD